MVFELVGVISPSRVVVFHTTRSMFGKFPVHAWSHGHVWRFEQNKLSILVHWRPNSF
jgi:hypothetical protein